MSEVMGLDVSHYQGTIDWKQVANAGKKFVIMKCMYEAQSHRIDEQFENNYRKSWIYGISRGVYIFTGRSSINNPEADAKALLGHLADRPLEYGIWLDYESEHLRKLSKDKLIKLTYVYADAFRAAGYHIGIYCNKDWYDHVIPKELKSDFDFWIARYKLNDDGSYTLHSPLRPSNKGAVAWQYTSKGQVPGIKNYVDLDVDFDGIVNLIGSAPYKKTNEEIAQEVLEGKWGTKNTAPNRRKLLERAGYNYKAIQKIVNDILKK